MYNSIMPELTDLSQDEFAQAFEYASNLCFSVMAKSEKTDIIKSENTYRDYLICRDSKALPRGFFCPSPIADVVMGQTKRGRLCNQIGQKGRFYKYCFDDKGNMRAIFIYENKQLVGVEQILSFGYVEYGIEYIYDGHFVSEYSPSFSECIYNENDQIIRYTNCVLNPSNNNISEITQEQYFYEGKQLIENNKVYVMAPMDIFNFFSNKFICRKDIFCYKSENGKLLEYTVSRNHYEKTYSVLLERRSDDFTYRPKFK